MNPSTSPLTKPVPLDGDLAEQARPGHGIPSQDLNPAAQSLLEPEEAQREANSVLTGGGVVAGAAAGVAIGSVVAGPVGAVVGGTVGAVAGALGGAAAGSMVTPEASSAVDQAQATAVRAGEPVTTVTTNTNLEMNMQRLKDVMSYDVQVISPDATIREAAARMRDQGFGMLPVGEHDRMIGAVTDRDIAMRAVAEGKGSDTLVRDVMSEDVIWCYDDDTVEKGADMMCRRQVRRLPVVNREKRLVGIVSLGDFAVAADDIQPTADALVGISQP
jgi:CBS domain-containing protein